MTPETIVYGIAILITLLLTLWVRQGRAEARCQAELDQLPSVPQNLQVEINPLIIELYRGADNDWRWRAKRSGRIVADSGEGYKEVDSLTQTLGHFLSSVGRRNYSLSCKIPGHGVAWSSDHTVLHFTADEKETPSVG